MIHIDYIGYDSVHARDFQYSFPKDHSFYLFILAKTPIDIYQEGEYVTYPAYTCILFPPNLPIRYKAAADIYKDDWIRFRATESYVQNLPLINTPFLIKDAEYCHTLIKLLTWESATATQNTSSNSPYILSQLFSALFMKLHDSCMISNHIHHYQDLLELHRDIYSNPQLTWNLQLMANSLHISTGYLQSIYKSVFGISCMDDVIANRIRLAKSNLLNSKMTIKEIAENCGYNNVEHFSRQFKKVTGLSPQAFRKQALIE